MLPLQVSLLIILEAGRQKKKKKKGKKKKPSFPSKEIMFALFFCNASQDNAQAREIESIC